MLGNADYCKKNPKRRCYKFTDGKEVCGCAGGWSIFFATMRKKGWSPEKSRPKKVSEAVFSEAVEEYKIHVLEWFVESTLKSSDVRVPNWVGLAQKAIKSTKLSEKVKAYWRKRLQSWCKENPKAKICKGDKK